MFPSTSGTITCDVVVCRISRTWEVGCYSSNSNFLQAPDTWGPVYSWFLIGVGFQYTTTTNTTTVNQVGLGQLVCDLVITNQYSY